MAVRSPCTRDVGVRFSLGPPLHIWNFNKVVSASITGLLVFGKPAHLNMNGLIKDAFTLVFTTLAWLLLFLGVVVIVLLV